MLCVCVCFSPFLHLQTTPLGYLQVDISSLQHNAWHSLSLPLTDGEGRVQLEIEFKPFVEAQPQQLVDDTASLSSRRLPRFAFPQSAYGGSWSPACVFLEVVCCKGLPSPDGTWMEVSCEGRSDDSIAVRASIPKGAHAPQHRYNQQFSFPVRHEHSAVLVALHGANKGVLTIPVMNILRLGAQTLSKDFSIPGVPGAVICIKLAGRMVDESRDGRADSPVEDPAPDTPRLHPGQSQQHVDPRVGTDMLHDSPGFAQLAACVQAPTQWHHHGFQAVCLLGMFLVGMLSHASSFVLSIVVLVLSYIFRSDVYTLLSSRQMDEGGRQVVVAAFEERLASAQALLADNQQLAALYDPSVLPPWVRFPDEERAFWVQQTLELIWPTISHGVIEANVKPLLESYLRQYRPAFLSHLDLTVLTCGSISPVVCGIKQYTSQQDNRERLIFDIKLHWAAADAHVQVRVGALGVQLPVVLRDISLSGTLRVALDPLIPIFPCFGALEIAFTSAPQVCGVRV
jgi:hypothetical protein